MGKRVAVVFVAALLVAACGSSEPAATPTTQPTSTSTEQMTATTGESETTTTVSITSTSAVATTTTTTALEIDVEFRNGEVSGADVIRVDLGDAVDIWVLSDVDDELHVHGYDLYYDVIGGEPLNLVFVADVPGIFEVEIHTGHTLLFDLEVAG